MHKPRIYDYIDRDAKRENVEKTHASHLDPKYNKEIYELGTQYALKGINLDDVPEYNLNKSFLNGYARGLRLCQIQLASQTNPIKRN